MTVVARFIDELGVHEVHCEAGKYTTRLYVREDDADRELTTTQAMELIDTFRHCGGLVMRRGEVDRG
jgi:hypothetical protein